MRKTHAVRRTVLTLGLASLAVTITAGPAAADPPTNSSFELPDLGPGDAFAQCAGGADGITGWVVTEGCVAIFNDIFIPATDGTQVADLGGTGASGVLQQVFNTLPNTGYTISWNFGANPGDSSGEVQTGTFSVQGAAVEAMSVARSSPTNPNWQTRTTTFAGTGGPVTLQFADTGDADGSGLLIDNVVITENGAIPIVDPKVAGVVLTLAAGGGLYLLHRKRTRDELDEALAA